MITGPAFVIQSINSQGSLAWLGLIGCGVGALYSFASHAVAWALHQKKHPRERAVLTGCAVGSSALLWSFPFAETVFGIVGMQTAVLFALSNIFSDHVLSYLNFASAGPAFPENYTHQDGAIYRGQWNGLKKHGVGVYKYASGATYEGEWKDNVKTGKGVYYFKKGGLYEGEWLNGDRNGLGVRTFSDGSFRAGRWMDNKLVANLELWQCQDVVTDATQAAKAAREVKVGGGKSLDVLHEVMIQPLLWVTVAALVVNFLNLQLSPTIDLVSRSLASLHRPLALFTAGAAISFADINVAQLYRALPVVSLRLCLALVMNSVLLFGAFYHLPAAVPFLMPLCVVLLAPVSQEALERVRLFRLNASCVKTISVLSSIASAGLLLALSPIFIFARAHLLPSELVMFISKLMAAAAVGVAVAAIVAAAVPTLRPRTMKRMTLTNVASSEPSELNTVELERLLDSVERSDNQPKASTLERTEESETNKEDIAGSFPPFFVDRSKGGDSPQAPSAGRTSSSLRSFIRTHRLLTPRGYSRQRRIPALHHTKLWQRNEMPWIKCRSF